MSEEQKTTTLSLREVNSFLIALEINGDKDCPMYIAVKALLDRMILKKTQEVTVCDIPFMHDIKRVAALYTEMKKEQKR